MGKNKKAVVLFSGGLDSTTALCWAVSKKYKCIALCIAYGQRHAKETLCAEKIAGLLGIPFYRIRLDLPWLKVSSLVDNSKQLPEIIPESIGAGEIPTTYVPGRNLIFVSLGVSLADAVEAGVVISGANALDFSGYPDCRPEFYRRLEKAVNTGTKAGAEGKGIKLISPLIGMNKAAIVRLAMKLKAPVGNTWSCYAGKSKPCGKCDSCKLRARGFKEAGEPDPAFKKGAPF